MKIETTVNRVRLRTFTDGHPTWVELAIDGVEVASLLTPEDLHDLRYAAERLLAQLAEAAAKK